MGLFSLFKGSEAAPARSSDEALVARARTSARRRLIGAVVLLGVGVVAFPLIFETQPRPIPVDIPIEIPRKDSQPPVALPPTKPAVVAASKPATVITESKAEAPREPATPASATVASTVPAAKPEPPRPAPKSESKPEAKSEAKAEPRPEPKPEAKAAMPAPAKPAPDAAASRFVVQVGAFAEASAVREVRGRVEKLGLATYTQSVDTPSGARTRVRVGPFASREEADKAAAKLKAAGLPGAVLTL